ncbi:hypothetical protein [Streptomyces sp. NPDC056227]|uniref:hypothetical protein n=1 Tax=Streptomyces sp. NPDC056227 TaxID=3345753 RepID=UPI0035E39C26
MRCPEFSTWWNDHRVLRRTHGTKYYHHPSSVTCTSPTNPSKHPATSTTVRLQRRTRLRHRPGPPAPHQLDRAPARHASAVRTQHAARGGEAPTSSGRPSWPVSDRRSSTPAADRTGRRGRDHTATATSADARKAALPWMRERPPTCEKHGRDDRI